MNPTTSSDRSEAFVQAMSERMAGLARALSDWVLSEPHTLQQVEQQLVRLLHELGTTLLTDLLALAATQPSPQVTCPCGQSARFQRLRPATLTTLLGRITLTRPYYHCSACAQGHAPLDSQLQVVAGGLSCGLSELLALLGATQDSFAQATEVLQRLCLVTVCPNSAREATEALGQALVAHDQQLVETAKQTHTPPAATQPAPARLYVSMDGVVAHIHGDGWREIKTGCIYTTRQRRCAQRPGEVELRAEAQSYLARLAEASSFGWQLWAEACRRGVQQTTEVVVIGDGAHWIWNLAEEHFPGATQIVDWYHASQYVWNAASAIFGERSELRTRWAKQQLDALWEGSVAQVVRVLQAHAGRQDAVDEAISYYTTHQERLDYPSYRARGLQLGSGTIESACKQLVSARLKLAGMIWDAEGAEAVAVVRAWLKSGRWDEAMHLRPPPRRTYQRRSASVAAA